MCKQRYPDNCPHCNALLDCGDIYQHFLSKGKSEAEAYEIAECYGWTKEKPRHFSRIIVVVDPYNDITLGHECPDCKKKIIPI